ncbi:MAG: TRAP transporter small permease [Halomonas sp.]|nr:TRAP transporter small permease [Halomonas sp.]
MSFPHVHIRKGLQHLDWAIGRVEAFVLIAGVLLMATNTIANVVGRYAFSQSLYFSEELNEFLIVAITFFGLGHVTRKGQHIRMSALYDLLSPRVRKLAMICIAALTSLVMFSLAWFALEYVEKVASRGRVTPALQVPLYLTYLWVVAGFTVTGVQYLLTVIKNLDFADERVYLSFSVVDEYIDPDVAEVMHLRRQEHETEPESGEKRSTVPARRSS